MSGSGAIGEAGLGTLIIGGLPFNWWATIQSEWANSPRLLAMIQAFADAMDQTQNVSNFLRPSSGCRSLRDGPYRLLGSDGSRDRGWCAVTEQQQIAAQKPAEPKASTP